jgi:methenyltetrahydrofolate cyclohydrolase
MKRRALTLLSEMKISDLLEKTASSEPLPGGGSMSALAAAVAASLVGMVANLTIGRKGFEDVAEEMTVISRKASHYREKFTSSIDRDSAAYGKVMEALQLPKGTENEKKTRSLAIQDALRLAAEVPLSVAEDVLDFMPFALAVMKKGNPNALTDGLVGVMMARTGALGALQNVKINLESIKDKAYVSDISGRVQEIERLVIQLEKKAWDCQDNPFDNGSAIK